MSQIAESDQDTSHTRQLIDDAAARRCLTACSAADHAHAEDLRRRGHSRPRSTHLARHERIAVAGKHEEAASRDLAQELRA
ncbi:MULTISPECIES: hypothetical protein [Xanthomonas]|uniref:Uncharacterized protein n=2 Tax=Xanthomonas citri TaxID=346 RepID=A0AB33CC29_XANCI|nr:MULTISPECIES: hypothetical protein [Xanthomonas]MBV6780924.1 hypothetical protein [Xanthomonas campestris pv. trichodesmae]ASK91844.1 hypothetical protein XcvCFBP7111P_10295 [Xanthomonas citri pv. vignicola]MBV6788448.1 hypothetical protein [Xanthomonas campestris pv. clerodendri]MBZ3919235.1 hypothetical protein [Xanthomonas campestris pv. trichodesmae]MBZ3922884.1 hypothetical protein [Xanthomonas citri pv. sesbaniae]